MEVVVVDFVVEGNLVVLVDAVVAGSVGCVTGSQHPSSDEQVLGSTHFC